MGSYRFCKIKDYGQGRMRYSNWFKTKCFLSLSIGCLNFISLFLVYLIPEDLDNTIWISQCGEKYWTVFYFLQGCVWLLAIWLMIYEYQRLLSEAWYANQLFWALTLLIELVDFFVLMDDYLSSPLMLVGMFCNLIGLTCLVVMMFFTEKRTLLNMRPQVGTEEVLLPEEGQRSLSKTSSMASNQNGPFIFVRFQEKCITAKGKNFF